VQVAVSNDGDVFVADGYCNSRIMHFAADGSFVQQIALPRVSIAMHDLGCQYNRQIFTQYAIK
jgi:NHL repeat